MSTTPITITVTYRNQAYHCRLQGVGASSTPGSGTLFRITLPVHQPAEPGTPE